MRPASPVTSPSICTSRTLHRDPFAPHPCVMHPANRRPILKLGIVDLGVENATLPNGVTVELAVIRHPGASAIVALDTDGTIAILTQYRHAIGGWLREIPAGCRNG